MDILGIDLAKLTFDATLHTTTGAQYYQVFPNTADGFAQLAAWLVQHAVSRVHACMEATNVYWEALATFLHAQGHTVSVVNPARIKGYAQATMQRNKTDKLDSAVIAAFCATHQPSAWQPLTDAQRRLRALVRHRDDLLQTRLQQQNRLRDTSDSLVRQSLQTVLDAVEGQLAAVDQQIREHLTTHPDLATNVALLTAVVGIGTVTAAKLLAEFAAMEHYGSAKAAAADTGVTPAHVESGTSVRRRPRMSKQGNANLRAALYWPAITAMTRCRDFKAFADRLAARGKPKKVIIGAVMRKLVHIIYGILKHQTPYDPKKAFGPAATAT
ncbi:MAG: transposase [Chloroflexaceae bacterium]|jgi:transposase|nr:transposase [Chloroflexaceae bacterium]